MTLLRRPCPTLAALTLLSILTVVAGCGPKETKVEIVPGEELVFALSKVSIRHAEHGPGESLRLALDVMEEIRNGEPIAEVSSRMSDDPQVAESGGWLGFLQPRGEDVRTGVAQALPIGMTSGPVASQDGFDVYYRHTMEEGREIERERVIPVYGFAIPYAEDAGSPAPTKEKAKEIAETALAKIQSGEMNLEEAKAQFAPPSRGEMNPFLVKAELRTQTEPLFRELEKVAEGEMAPVVELPGAYGVLRRGVYFRSLVRHIMILHSDTPPQGENAPRVQRTRDEARQIAEDVLVKVKPDGSNWHEMVKEYSDEDVTVAMDGLIGCVTNGHLMPVLEDAVIDATPGRVLDRVVESPGGFHIIWRVN